MFDNPLIPGDPYMYDVKWIIRNILEHSSELSSLDEKIQKAVIAALDQHDPIYFESADALINSGIKAGALAYIEGYYTPGDGGANLYITTDDYNDIIGADFYITLADPNMWALPVILTPFVTPEMFGAYGDGISDDTNAMKAFALHTERDQIALNNYKVSETITINSKKQGSINIAMLYGTIEFIECDNCNISVISIGDSYNGGHVYTGLENFNFPNLTDIGVCMTDCYSNVCVIGSYRHEIGLRLTGNSKGCVYNTITLKSISDNVVGIDLYNENSGWTNENLFFAGSISNSNGNPHKAENIGIRMWRAAGNGNTINSNLFIKPAFEMWGLPIKGDNANYNAVISARGENQTALYADFSSSCSYNSITLAYSTAVADAQLITKNSGFADNLGYKKETELITNGFRNVFHYQFESPSEISYIGNGTKYYKFVPRLNSYRYGASGLINPDAVYYDLTSDLCIDNTNGLFIQDSYGYGRAININGVTKIGLQAKVTTGNIRFSISCYDGNNSPVALNSNSFAGAGWSFNNNEIRSSSNQDGRFMTVTILDTSIKRIIISVRSFPQNAVINSFDIYSGNIDTYFYYDSFDIEPVFNETAPIGQYFIKYGKAGEILPYAEIETGTDATGTYYITSCICTTDGNNWQKLKSYI